MKQRRQPLREARPMATRNDGPILTYGQFLAALLSDRERFFEEVVDGTGLDQKLRYAALTVVALAGFFGLVTGAYSGPAQAVSAAIKLPFLFLAPFEVCYSQLFVFGLLIGSALPVP